MLSTYRLSLLNTKKVKRYLTRAQKLDNNFTVLVIFSFKLFKSVSLNYDNGNLITQISGSPGHA